MFSFLKSIAIRRKNSGRPSADGNRRAPLSLQRLEERQLLSGSPLLVTVAPLYGVVAQVQPPVTPYSLSSATSTTVTLDPVAALDPSVLQRESQSIALKPTFGYTSIPPVLDNVLDGPITISQDQGRIAIANKASEFRSKLGNPLPGFEYSQPSMGSYSDGYGRYQYFQNGAIFWSPATAKNDIGLGLNPSTAGAHVVMGPIRDRYFKDTSFGYPTIDQSRLAGPTADAVFNNFYNPYSGRMTTIVYTPNIGAFVVSGAIRQKWIELGAGKYGVPTNYQIDKPGAYVFQDFTWSDSGQGATIVSSGQTGTHDVAGAIRDKWISWGAFKWGSPTTDSTVYSASGNRLNSVVHFRKFDSNGPHDSAFGTSSKGTFGVYGEIYTAWISMRRGEQEFGLPISDEYRWGTSGYDHPFDRESEFISPQGVARRIVWNSELIDELKTQGHTHFGVDYGNVLQQLDFTPRGGPTGFEPIDGPTGASSSPLTMAALDLSVLVHDSTLATDTTRYSALDLSVLVHDSIQATDTLAATPLTVSSTTLQTGPVDSVSQLGGATRAVRGYHLSYIPPDLASLSSSTSDEVLSDADLAAVFGTPFDPATDLGAGVAPDATIPAVPEGGDLASAAGGAFGIDAPQVLPAEVTQLDQAQSMPVSLEEPPMALKVV